jgi:pSer/pThr/pTyr-binding forkhead associated (FHA) protein
VTVLPPSLRSVTPAELAERLAAERRGLPLLVYLDGDGRQRVVELDDGPRSVCVGRDPDADVPLTWDTEVSRVHALVERTAGCWTLVDDGLSRNGTFLDGQRLRGRQRLRDGDAISVGRTTLVFLAAAEAGTTQTTRYGGPPPLSPAQRRVLDALCAPVGDDRFAPPASNREIADQLVLSIETIKSHLQALFEHFGVDDLPPTRKRNELVRRAFERGAVVPARLERRLG